jgi:hypothetical protein
MIKARELAVGDVFGLAVFGEVVEASSVADGKRIKIKLLLEDQAALEFVDAGCTVEFLCRPGRNFSVWMGLNDDRNKGGREVDPNPTGGGSPVLIDAE